MRPGPGGSLAPFPEPRMLAGRGEEAVRELIEQGRKGTIVWGRQLECLWEGVEEALLNLSSLRDRIR